MNGTHLPRTPVPTLSIESAADLCKVPRMTFRAWYSCFFIPLALAACSSDDQSSLGSGGKSGGGTGGVGATGGSGGTTGGSGGGGGSAGTPTGGSGGTAGSSTGGAPGGGGVAGSSTGGTGGSGGTFPTCNQAPTGAPTKAIAEIWNDNPTSPAAAWVPGVYITAISGGKCTNGIACQLFVQQKETFASWAAGAHQGIRVNVPGNVSIYFTQVSVGDQVDLYGSAWRHTTGVENELYFDVSNSQVGCIKKTGTGNIAPIQGVTLLDLTVNAYETTHGPLFIQLDAISGKPGQPSETFALWKQGQFTDAGISEVVSLSPFFTSGGVFVGLSDGLVTNFTYLRGVFGLFVPSASTTKYKELYIRDMTDAPISST